MWQWPSLRKEIRCLFGPLRHPRIVAAMGATKDPEGHWALVLRRYTRGSLAHPTQAVASADLPVVAFDIAQALAHVHGAGFIHGDVKDSNVLLEVEGGRVRAVLADFGCVQRADEPQKDTRLGTSLYRDPRCRRQALLSDRPLERTPPRMAASAHHQSLTQADDPSCSMRAQRPVQHRGGRVQLRKAASKSRPARLLERNQRALRGAA